jgi:hypothetical protein
VIKTRASDRSAGKVSIPKKGNRPGEKGLGARTFAAAEFACLTLPQKTRSAAKRFQLGNPTKANGPQCASGPFTAASGQVGLLAADRKTGLRQEGFSLSSVTACNGALESKGNATWHTRPGHHHFWPLTVCL